MIDYKKLVDAGVHFGHKKSRWHPQMEPYIWGIKNDIHLIDISKTALQLEKAVRFLQSVAAEGKCILLIGTKKAAQEIIAQAGKRLGCPFVIHRWIGGTLTNYSQVKKSITKLLHMEEVIQKSDRMLHTKKELGTLQKAVDRLSKNVGNIRNITLPIGAIVLVDVKKEQTTLREAAMMSIPVVALVDTNSDPSMVDYVIPSNDDAPKAIAIIVEYLAEAIEKGKQESQQKLKEGALVKQIEKEQGEATLLVEDEDVESADFTDEEKKAKALLKKVKAKDAEALVLKKTPTRVIKKKSTRE